MRFASLQFLLFIASISIFCFLAQTSGAQCAGGNAGNCAFWVEGGTLLPPGASTIINATVNTVTPTAPATNPFAGDGLQVASMPNFDYASGCNGAASCNECNGNGWCNGFTIVMVRPNGGSCPSVSSLASSQPVGCEQSGDSSTNPDCLFTGGTQFDGWGGENDYYMGNSQEAEFYTPPDMYTPITVSYSTPSSGAATVSEADNGVYTFCGYYSSDQSFTDGTLQSLGSETVTVNGVIPLGSVGSRTSSYGLVDYMAPNGFPLGAAVPIGAYMPTVVFDNGGGALTQANPICFLNTQDTWPPATPLNDQCYIEIASSDIGPGCIPPSQLSGTGQYCNYNLLDANGKPQIPCLLTDTSNLGLDNVFTQYQFIYDPTFADPWSVSGTTNYGSSALSMMEETLSTAALPDGNYIVCGYDYDSSGQPSFSSYDGSGLVGPSQYTSPPRSTQDLFGYNNTLSEAISYFTISIQCLNGGCATDAGSVPSGTGYPGFNFFTVFCSYCTVHITPGSTSAAGVTLSPYSQTICGVYGELSGAFLIISLIMILLGAVLYMASGVLPTQTKGQIRSYGFGLAVVGVVAVVITAIGIYFIGGPLTGNPLQCLTPPT